MVSAVPHMRPLCDACYRSVPRPGALFQVSPCECAPWSHSSARDACGARGVLSCSGEANAPLLVFFLRLTPSKHPSLCPCTSCSVMPHTPSGAAPRLASGCSVWQYQAVSPAPRLRHRMDSLDVAPGDRGSGRGGSTSALRVHRRAQNMVASCCRTLALDSSLPWTPNIGSRPSDLLSCLPFFPPRWHFLTPPLPHLSSPLSRKPRRVSRRVSLRLSAALEEGMSAGHRAR